ncbi:glycosyltransferase family 4 protein [Martelella radicis]|uniref:Glycosyltransferase involved in cell wall biosynthesis n=1 Tax=Martelella radicis TaxID=1397476 RepID=A0A7W6KMV3_9HYPH|nr:glycosyltransferase family 4 protein [Martelella radicis]MBB4122693.1 glycosyltransferase involved in cell wall biosynthesis [Martelella radicis]
MTHDKTRAAQGDVVISAGDRNFHLLFTAAEMAKRGRLSMLFCGAYPTRFEKRLLANPRLPGARKFARLLNRQEAIPEDLIRQNRRSEFVSATGISLQRFPKSGSLNAFLQTTSFQMYGRNAARHLPEAAENGARIYHYRAGFGQSSVKVAAEAGMRTICDHSIVHPSLLDVLVDGRGKFPEDRPSRPTGIWGAVLDDIDKADIVLVNSDFVAKTFSFMGFDQSRLAVVYQGVEDKFLARLPDERGFYEVGSSRPVRFLFAGGIGPRKGFDEIAAALAAIPSANIELHLAGSLSQSSREDYAELLADPRVTYHGVLSQNDLAMLMHHSDVFLFPSRAEGSARVVFEAMAAGCAVITTENAGSIVRHGEGGLLVPVNDHEALIGAIEDLLRDTALLADMGSHNGSLIRNAYTQSHYGDNLERLYGLGN